MPQKDKSSWFSRKNLFFIGFFLFGILLIIYQLIYSSLQRNLPGVPPTLITFRSKIRPFSIEYPKGWTVRELPQGNHGDLEQIAVINPLGQDYPFITIANREIKSGTLDEALTWGIEKGKRCKDFVPETPKRLTISGREGISFEYTCTVKAGIFLQNDLQVNCIDYLILDGVSAYSVNFCADKDQWSNYEKTFVEMMNGFHAN